MTASLPPDDGTVPNSVPALLAAFEAGQALALERGTRLKLAQSPDDVLARSLLAASLQMQGRVGEALELHQGLTQLQPQDAAHWNNLGTALRETGQPEAARQAYLHASQLDPADAMTHHNLGLLAMEAGDYADARGHLLDACDRDPHRPIIRLHAAMACHECGDFQREQALIAPWRKWPPLDEDSTIELAWLLAHHGQTEQACQLLRDCAAQMAQPERAWARLVLVLERVNQLEAARLAAAQLPPVEQILDPSSRDDVLNAGAVLAMREGQWEQARLTLETLVDGAGDKRKLSNLYFALARARDRLGLPDAAMQACQQAHAAQVAGVAPLVPELMVSGASPLPVARHRWSAQRYATAIPVIAPEALASPVFVVGFPRSGTTLLEQMLDAHPGLCAMDEQPFLQGLADRLTPPGGDWTDTLGELDQQACDALRREYWQRVHGVVRPAQGQRLVDKNPLNLLRLPLIQRLFPNARVILALRHPCDVLLSCYMQAFRSPAFAMLCSDLGRLAHGYAEAMEHWRYHADLLQIATLEVRYEDLVDDTATQVQRLGDFLGLDDPAQLLGFQRHAQAKGYISTPSYSQVVEGINRKGLNRWHAYRAYFEPVLPILQPYLDRWGYQA